MLEDTNADATTVPPALSANLPTPSPFLKWVGGKKRLLAQYAEHFPADYDGYHEPFVGGGAVFFNLNPATATLSDLNPRLIETYRAIRDDLGGLIDRLAHHKAKHDKGYYYESRTRFNGGRRTNATDRAALMIYLNKTCFNGLYRENRRGEFNVPIGRYKNPSIYNADHLLAVSTRLQGVDLHISSFDAVLSRAKPGDLVYFDPPYVPLNATSSFTSYTKAGFDAQLQQRLAEVFTELSHRGCAVMLSNSDTPYVRDLFAGFQIHQIMAPRSINSKASGRGAVAEVLVKSW